MRGFFFVFSNGILFLILKIITFGECNRDENEPYTLGEDINQYNKSNTEFGLAALNSAALYLQKKGNLDQIDVLDYNGMKDKKEIRQYQTINPNVLNGRLVKKRFYVKEGKDAFTYTLASKKAI